MAPSGPNYTWTFSEKSWIIRFYLWLTEGDKDQISFCKLFWAVLFFPLLTLLHGVRTAVEWVLDVVDEMRDSRGPKIKTPKVPKPRKVRTGPTWADRLITWFSYKADNVAAFFQVHPGYGKTVRGILLGLAFLIPLGILSFVAWVGVVYTTGFLVVMAWIGSILGLGIAWVGIVTGIIYLIEDTKFFQTAGKPLFAIGRGVLGAWHFLAAGEQAIKNRSCPRVVVTK
jgi:hypothetical protein